MPAGRTRGCGVCDSLSRSFVCVNCLGVVHQERRNQLQQLQRKRSDLLLKLSDLFTSRSKWREQVVEREQRIAALHDARDAADSAQAQLLRAQEQLEELRSATAMRRSKLERLHAQVLGSRSDMLLHHFPHLIRYQSLTHQHVSSMLLREQKVKVKQVLDILPLKVEGIASGEGSLVVSICGLRVPDDLAHLLDGRQPPESTSAALGYMLLLLDLLGTYLGGPLLHEGSFQGSTTVVWQQQTFWNRRPASSNSVLPLYTEDMPQGSVLMPALTTKSPSSSSWPLSLGRALRPADKSAASRGVPDSSDGSYTDGSLQGSKYAELQSAFEMLQRSISCFVRDLVSPLLGVQLPGTWGPVAWLVMLCELYHRDSRTEGVLQAARVLTEDTAREVAAGGQEATRPGGDTSSRQASSAAAHQGADGCDDEEEEWDVVQPPLLPPKPSESDAELDHWTRAMMPGGGRGMQQQQQPAALAPAIGAAAAAMRNALGMSSSSSASDSFSSRHK